MASLVARRRRTVSHLTPVDGRVLRDHFLLWQKHAIMWIDVRRDIVVQIDSHGHIAGRTDAYWHIVV
jgi:hypothetical protein